MSAPAGRRLAFGLTWLSYASLYLCRKGVAVSKASLVRDLSLTEGTLAAIDTAYLVTYAFGQFLSGVAVQRLGARRVIAIGLAGSALACFAFGASTAGWVLVACFAVNGIFQATGWPAGTSVMAAWYPGPERGAAMGFWATNYQAGGLAGTALATLLLAHFGWRVAIAGPGLWLLVYAVVVLVALRDRPPAAPPPDDEATASASTPAARRGGLRTALRDPAVWVVATAHVCLKVILYGLLFWIPYFLHTAHGYDDATAGYLSVALEAGGIVGTIVTGRLSDLAVRRGRGFVAAVMMLLLTVVLAAQALLPAGGPPVMHAAWIAIVGFFLFGPESLVAGAAAQDLGVRHGTSVAVGVVNGIGSLGAILQGVVTLGLRDAFGWSGAFAGLAVLSAMGALALFALPLASRAAKE